jgi:hypothetical protein
MKLSAEPAERSPEIMWMKSTEPPKSDSAAENSAILHRFYGPQLTGRNGVDCYTLEHFAALPAVIHTTCYYYYKRISLSLKEVTEWS